MHLEVASLSGSRLSAVPEHVRRGGGDTGLTFGGVAARIETERVPEHVRRGRWETAACRWMALMSGSRLSARSGTCATRRWKRRHAVGCKELACTLHVKRLADERTMRCVCRRTGRLT